MHASRFILKTDKHSVNCFTYLRVCKSAQYKICKAKFEYIEIKYFCFVLFFLLFLLNNNIYLHQHTIRYIINKQLQIYFLSIHRKKSHCYDFSLTCQSSLVHAYPGFQRIFFLIDISRRSRVNEAQSAEEKKITSGHRSTQPHFHARSRSNISPMEKPVFESHAWK